MAMTKIVREPTSLIPLMVVSFNIGSDAKNSFDQFYNQEFLPQLFSLSPQLRAIKRYEKTAEINLALDQKSVFDFQNNSDEYWTIYQLDGQLTLDRTDEIFSHIQFSETLTRFRQFKDSSLANFLRVNYDQISGLRRENENEEEHFGADSPVFAAFLTFSVLPAEEDLFIEWYAQTYQNEMFEVAPSLQNLRSYRVWKQDQCDILTVFESNDESGLVDALEKIQHRANSNRLWRDFLTDGTILCPRAILTRPIFDLPGV